MTLLVRVPEAYELVQEYGTVRPGFLVLQPDGTKWGSVALSTTEPRESAEKATEYLARALRSEEALPDQHDYPEADPLLLRGTLVVNDVESGSEAEKAGFRVGDRLRTLDGAAIEGFSDLDADLLRGRADEVVVFELEREGTTVTITHRGALAGIQWAFHGIVPPR